MKVKQLFEAITSARQRLYHFTTLIGLRDILRTGIIANGDPAHWDMKTGTYTKYEKSYVSFTRNKRYKYKSGQDGYICFVFDQDVLRRKGYKMRPYSYPFPISGNDWTVDISKYKAESEELVLGPVKLMDGLIEIVISRETKDKIDKWIRDARHNRDDSVKALEYAKQNTFTDEVLKLVRGRNYDPTEYERLMTRHKDNPDWRPIWFTVDGLKKRVIHFQSVMNEYRDLLSRVRVGEI